VSILGFVIGLGLPAACGWLLLRLCEGHSPVLGRAERCAAGLVAGGTITMAIVFTLHATTGMPLSRAGFLGTELILLAVLGGLYAVKRPTGISPALPASPRPRWEPLVWALLAFAVTKIVFASVTFLLLTPTYLDDTLDNWNLRGKVFFEDQRLTLALPGEDPIASPKGVSSYPPAVPLLKASMAAIAGEWSDPLANAPHAVWFAAAATLLYAAVRRALARHWALLAVYGYLSLPLATMHGTNPYADVFVSAHVFLAAAWMLAALKERNENNARSWFLLTGIALGALSFTKNEGMIVYTPPLILILVLALAWRWKTGRTDIRSIVGTVARVALPLAVVALPWLLFKWANGLTFGNAKPFTEFTIRWRENVLMSVGVNTFLEGNWLLLFPLFFGLLAWRRRAAWIAWLPLTAFVCIVYFGQLTLFLFTDLAVEALMQTGYARGLIQLMPCIVLLTALLLANAAGDDEEALA
jgi:hypothetical protein